MCDPGDLLGQSVTLIEWKPFREISRDNDITLPEEEEQMRE
jgi:hypothetical protein